MEGLQKLSNRLYEIALKHKEMLYEFPIEDSGQNIKIYFEYIEEKHLFTLIIDIPNEGKIIEDSYLNFSYDALKIKKNEFINKITNIFELLLEQEPNICFINNMKKHLEEI